MTAQRTNDPHAQPPSRSAADFIEPEAIARRAYELFQERGREPGCELDDWLRAEHELAQSNDDLSESPRR
jgi:hypothetical protein